jgi:predicted nucleotidyltransferase
MRLRNLEIDTNELAKLCKKWSIARIEVFGSALRDDFGPESDIDLLVSFQPEAHVGLFQMDLAEAELSRLFGRKVDLVSRRGIEASENWIRKQDILSSAVQVFAA